jgi:formylglycine-generating enzyme required for sulfatase activity
MAELFRYAAFISYSSKDAMFARRLHRALESYGIPSSLGKFDLIGGGKKNRVYPVFRDREELAAGHLGDVIEANLKASAALIIVCSPHAAASPWVQKEIEYFVSLGRRDKIFAIIADTSPTFDDSGADATASCFPPAFRGDALAGDKLEPLAADARKGKDGFRNAWLKLVAGMIGVTPGQIIDRDKRQRRQRALRTAVASLLPVVGIAAAWMNWDRLQPVAESYLKYRFYGHSTVALMTGPTGPASAFQDCAEGSADCPVMIVLPAGAFMMGTGPDHHLDAEDTRPSEQPQHRVSIRRFAVSRNDITFADWQACVNAGGCHNTPHPDDSHWGHGARPVINVSWIDAQEYAAWLTLMTGRHYRLLSESEWEYAARGVTTADALSTRFNWGDSDPLCEALVRRGAAYDECWESVQAIMRDLQMTARSTEAYESPGKTFPVGSFQANQFGLFDMAGNVNQWVEDCHHADYNGAPADGSAWLGGECSYRVLRGGSFRDVRQNLRSASRRYSSPDSRDDNIGFRVARVL